MAQAVANVEVIHKIESVTLNLSEDEVNTLIAIMARIGGSPTHSPRRHVSAISNALYKALNVPGYYYMSLKEYAALSDSTGMKFENDKIGEK